MAGARASMNRPDRGRVVVMKQSAAPKRIKINIFTKRTAAAALMMLASPIAIPTAANAAGMGHSFFMRGSVVDMTNGTPTICIGKADGAKVGQTLDVVRVTSLPGAKGGTSFRRDDVSQIRINAVVDDDFATATVIKGKVAENDIVELRKD